MPMNAFIVLKVLLDFANFDLFPSDRVNGAFLEFKENPEPYHYRFEITGYETYNFISNIGSIFINILVLILLLLFTLFLYSLCCQWTWLDTLYTKLRAFMFYNAFIRLLLEAYLEITVGVFVNLKLQDYSLSGEALATYLSFFFVVVVTVAPFAVLGFLLYRYSTLHYDEYLIKYGSLYDCLRYQESRYIVVFHFLFLIRRYFYALVIMGLADYQGIQA